jgi:hypothetical protein
MSPFFFYDFQRKGGFCSAAVEVYDAGGNIVGRTRVELSERDFFAECEEVGVTEITGTDNPEGLCEFTWQNTDSVFQALHVRSEFPNLKTV